MAITEVLRAEKTSGKGDRTKLVCNGAPQFTAGVRLVRAGEIVHESSPGQGGFRMGLIRG